MFPVCSFCGRRPVVAWFEGPHFNVSIDAAEKVRAEEAWLACATCLALVRAGDRDRLVQRGMKRFRGPGSDSENIVAHVRWAHEQFWVARGHG